MVFVCFLQNAFLHDRADGSVRHQIGGSAYPVIGMSAFALRLPAGDSFEPERLKIKNDEDGSMFSVYYEDELLEFLFVGDNDSEFADEANYKVFFDGSWIKPWETDE